MLDGSVSTDKQHNVNIGQSFKLREGACHAFLLTDFWGVPGTFAFVANQ